MSKSGSTQNSELTTQNARAAQPYPSTWGYQGRSPCLGGFLSLLELQRPLGIKSDSENVAFCRYFEPHRMRNTRGNDNRVAGRPSLHLVVFHGAVDAVSTDFRDGNA